MTAATNLNALLRVPGRLCLGPTDLTQAFPYGGTDLGLVKDIVARPGRVVKKLREEHMGAATTFAINLGEAWALSFALRALEQGNQATFFTTETGSSSGEPGIVHNPLTTPPGTTLATVALLFAPFDELEQVFIYFPAALVYPGIGAEMARSSRREGLMLGAADATPRSSDGLAVYAKKKEDLVL